MARSSKGLVLLLSLVIIIGLTSFANAQYKVGDTVSNFRMKDTTGKYHMLSQYAGSIIVLNFFATW